MQSRTAQEKIGSWDVRWKGRVTRQTPHSPRGACCAGGFDEPPKKLQSGMLGVVHDRSFARRQQAEGNRQGLQPQPRGVPRVCRRKCQGQNAITQQEIVVGLASGTPPG